MDDYWLWVLLAVTAGVIANSGIILQKKAVNEIPTKAREKRFFRSLVRNPVWLLGIILGMFAPVALVIGANMYIGPALVPGLMNSGLIVLAVGSVRINKERLRTWDYFGIVLMIAAIFFLGLSQLSINMVNFDYSAQWFLINSTLFTMFLFAMWAILFAIQKKNQKNRAVLLIFAAGFMLVMINFWIAPLSGTILKVLQGTATSSEWMFFTLACILTPLGNVFAVANQQTAYKYGQASTLNTLQQLPTQVTPAFIYLFVFGLTPPFVYSLPLLFLGIALVLMSSYLLAIRKVQIDKIK